MMDGIKDKVFLRGFAIEELPNLAHAPYATFRHKDGRIVRLPADPYSLNHYLAKGLVLVDGPDKPPKTRKSRKRRKA